MSPGGFGKEGGNDTVRLRVDLTIDFHGNVRTEDDTAGESRTWVGCGIQRAFDVSDTIRLSARAEVFSEDGGARADELLFLVTRTYTHCQAYGGRLEGHPCSRGVLMSGWYLASP